MASKAAVRDRRFAEVDARAHAAGLAAGEAKQPAAMVVVQRENPFDDTSRVVRRYAPVEAGVCGFAWVTVVPGTSSFARWAKQNRGARKGYDGGVQFSVRAFGQSYERKVAYAEAYVAEVRRSLPDVKVYAESRLD